jgi:hypothetical protein
LPLVPASPPHHRLGVLLLPEVRALRTPRGSSSRVGFFIALAPHDASMPQEAGDKGVVPELPSEMLAVDMAVLAELPPEIQEGSPPARTLVRRRL